MLKLLTLKNGADWFITTHNPVSENQFVFAPAQIASRHREGTYSRPPITCFFIGARSLVHEQRKSCLNSHLIPSGLHPPVYTSSAVPPTSDSRDGFETVAIHQYTSAVPPTNDPRDWFGAVATHRYTSAVPCYTSEVPLV